MRPTALAGFLIFLLTGPAAQAGPRQELVVQNSTVVLREIQSIPDQNIPDRLLQRAKGIAILPGVWKVGLGFGGRGGNGVMLVRDESGSWTNPAFVRIGGVSFGAQIGGQKADIVLVFTTRQSVEGIADGEMTFGADASIAAGPVGRGASAATNLTLDKEVYSYSRTQGLFAGIALDGSAITINRKGNASYYDAPDVTVTDIFAGRTKAPGTAARELIEELNRATAPHSSTAAPAATAGAASQPAEPPPSASPAPAPAQTFPLEDARPGAEPN
jgi:lipid-binding SYLF domain-containing protein